MTEKIDDCDFELEKTKSHDIMRNKRAMAEKE